MGRILGFEVVNHKGVNLCPVLGRVPSTQCDYVSAGYDYYQMSDFSKSCCETSDTLFNLSSAAPPVNKRIVMGS